MSKRTIKVLHDVTTKRNYINTKLIEYNGRIFKFVHELTNGTNRFTIELFDGNQFNFITGLNGLGFESNTPEYDVDYTSSSNDKIESTHFLYHKGIEFIILLFPEK